MSRDAEALRSEVAAGAGLVSVATLVGGILGLALVACLTRLLDPATFALLAVVRLLEETVHAVGNLGLPAALAYFVPKAGTGAARALGLRTGVLLFAVAVPIAAALLWIGPLFSGAPSFSTALAYLAVYVLADFPAQTLPAHLLASRSYRPYLWVSVAFAASRLASLVVPAALGLPFETMLAAFVAVAVARFVAFAGYFVFIARGSLWRVPFRLGEILAYGVPLSLSLAVGKINVQIDKYLVAALCAAEVFAVYAVGATELPLVPVLAYAVTNAIVPALVVSFDRGDVDGFVACWHGAVVKVAAIVMPAFLYFFVLAEPTMRVLFSGAFADASVPFRAYLLLLPLRLCGYGAVVRALGDTRPVLVSSVVALCVNAILLYPLYSLVGIAGPALATVLGQLAAIAVLLAAIRRQLGLSWARVFPWSPVLVATGVAALSAVPLVAVAAFVPGDGLRLCVGLAVLATAYVALGLRAGVVTLGDFRYLGRVLTLRSPRG